MVPPQQRMTAGGEPTAATTPAEKGTLVGTLVHLWPYIWPGDRADLKMRVIWSVVLLIGLSSDCMEASSRQRAAAPERSHFLLACAPAFG